MPPSPRLSARRISVTYLNDTTSISIQKRMDSTPSKWAGSRSVCTLNPVRQARNVYNGLVPMSPYTTPSAPRTSAAREDGAWPAGA